MVVRSLGGIVRRTMRQRSIVQRDQSAQSARIARPVQGDRTPGKRDASASCASESTPSNRWPLIVQVGFDGLNPMEAKAGCDVVNPFEG